MGYELQYGSDWANVASCRELDLGLPSTSQTDEPVVQNGCVGCPASPTGQAAVDRYKVYEHLLLHCFPIGHFFLAVEDKETTQIEEYWSARC